MSKTLKQQNQVSILLFALINTCVIAALLGGWENFIAFLSEVSKGNLALLTRTLGVPAIAGLLAGLVSWVVPRNVKETLVFWRVGPRRMPSSRAFSQIANADPRIDVKQLRERIGEFPVSPSEQSSRWYSIYRKHVKEPAVEDANRAYLLYRDMTSLVPIVAITAVTVALLVALPAHPNWTATTFLVLEFLMTALAARNAGTRLVANVLAIESSEPARTTPQRATPSKPRTRKADST